MTDGLYIDTTKTRFTSGDDVAPPSKAPSPEPTLDITTFAQRITLQPVSTNFDLLYAIAADLVAKGYPGVAFEIRRAADDLKHLTRCHAPKV